MNSNGIEFIGSVINSKNKTKERGGASTIHALKTSAFNHTNAEMSARANPRRFFLLGLLLLLSLHLLRYEGQCVNLPDLRTFDLLAQMHTLAVHIAKSSKYNSPLSLHVDSMFYLVVGVSRRSNVHFTARPSAPANFTEPTSPQFNKKCVYNMYVYSRYSRQPGA